MNEVATEVIIIAVGVVVALLGLAALFLFRKIGAYIDAKKAAQIEGSLEARVWTAAKEAYSWAELHGKGLLGSEKMDIAYDYGVKALNAIGVNVNADRLKASIQRAWVELERIPKETGSVSPTQIQSAINEGFRNVIKEDK